MHLPCNKHSNNFRKTANQGNVIDFDLDIGCSFEKYLTWHVLYDAHSASLNRMLNLKLIAANLINWIRNWHDGIISVRFKPEHSSSRYEDCCLQAN